MFPKSLKAVHFGSFIQQSKYPIIFVSVSDWALWKLNIFFYLFIYLIIIHLFIYLFIYLLRFVC